MKIVFLSNYYNHHQKQFSDTMYELLGENFSFIESERMTSERIALGWKLKNVPRYVINIEDRNDECCKLINEADVVIFGSAPYSLVLNRLIENKLTFLYTERIYKDKVSWPRMIKHRLLFKKKYGRFDNLYCLCSSAFTSFDFKRAGTLINKCFKWGYFPPMREYPNIGALIDNKKAHSILWCARFIDWKHPELCLELAKYLESLNLDFTINMIGNGPLMEPMSQLIQKNCLKNIKILGSMKPEEVRNYMEQSAIFIFTSDRREGWGAVLNEAMNSGCAVVASSEIGAVPYLIENKTNGLIYKDGNKADLFTKVKYLLLNNDICKNLGIEAYETVNKMWNARNAANRFVNLAELLLQNPTATLSDIFYNNGPCSKAEIIKDGWYR